LEPAFTSKTYAPIPSIGVGSFGLPYLTDKTLKSSSINTKSKGIPTFFIWNQLSVGSFSFSTNNIPSSKGSELNPYRPFYFYFSDLAMYISYSYPLMVITPIFLPLLPLISLIAFSIPPHLLN
jgi:hypothetical protein